MLRSVSAVVVGYLVFAIPAFLLFRLTGRDPHASATAAFTLLSIILGTVVAFAGGYLSAVVGNRAPIWHSGTVGMVIALVALLSIVLQHAQGALWTQVAAILVMAPSAALGGFLRAAQICRPVPNSSLQYR